ncbi:MAG: hypothetical protein V4509_03565 [Patescibacteria group bacterium]
MNEKIEKLKDFIIKASSDEGFVHHIWFVGRHLNIVEKIALEICEKYPGVDIDLVRGMVWIHDYPKMVDRERQHDLPFAEEIIRPLLKSLEFDTLYIDRLIGHHNIFESKMTTDLSLAPIEVRIVSSADGASHMFANFFSIYWKENAEKDLNYLSQSNGRKIRKDWERKIVIQEVKEALRARYEILSDQEFYLKDRFLNL